MAEETTITTPGLFQDMRDAVNTVIDKFESEQSRVNKAFFDCLSQDQRDTFCKSLANQDVKSKRIEKITGKSQPTINRHLNGKNS